MDHTSHKNSLWRWTDGQGGFRVQSPDLISRLYFPLANEAGILSSITPDLHGDIKTSHDSFLLLPVSAEDLHNVKSSRNFWAHVEGRGAWSLTGVSSAQQDLKFTAQKEKTALEAGMLWHKVIRESPSMGLRSEIVNFVPAGPDKVELMVVSLANIGGTRLKITPTAAIPIFGRSADNLRDHHHVTSLLHRVGKHPFGIAVKPTMSFDERGHKINSLSYAVLGVEENGDAPVGVFPTVPEFIGEGGHLEKPEAVVKNMAPPQRNDDASWHGKSAIGALRFKSVTLAPRAKIHFVLILGIAEKDEEIEEWLKKFGSLAKAEMALKHNRLFWAEKTDRMRFETQDKTYDAWLRWVSLQPALRKLFGCSFLPDFDYGRGGRGWRDLWQDCLALLLFSPAETRKLLTNNFNGIRIDGSNATIIGPGAGQFIADRNRITRVWMDHGVWPYLTLELYVHQTGDTGVLFENTGYFRDTQLSRGQKKDSDWSETDGGNLKTKKGGAVQGSILEHLLIQHLVQFYNVGEHNHIRLENADWNDGLDMAWARGESVAFTTLYASNLRKMAELLEEVCRRKAVKKVPLQRELLLLLDRVSRKKADYGSVADRVRRLRRYFDAVEPWPSGKTTQVPVAALVADLREKSGFLTEWVRRKEWHSTQAGDGFYNGYYDNHGRRVEGDFPNGVRLTLAGQVFPIMSGVATPEQTLEIYKTVKKHLRDKEHGGFHLNTDFHEIRPDLGRAFSFAYGEKENGAFFNHMVVMFANALYQRNLANEGREVLGSIFRMCSRTEKSLIYPGIPEYFNAEGRGMYHYLTGSASWYLLTLLTQVYGVRGFYGDLLLAPKLTQEDFHHGTAVSVETVFADRKIKVTYKNTKKIPYEHFCVTRVEMNGRELKGLELNKKEALVPRDLFLKHAKKTANHIVVVLE